MKYILYSKYLKNKRITDEQVFISKTNNSYLIGPKINNKFDEYSFYKRLISSSIYNKKIYKFCFRRKGIKLINMFYNKINDNEILEIFKNGSIVKHKILTVPQVNLGGNNEKE